MSKRAVDNMYTAEETMSQIQTGYLNLNDCESGAEDVYNLNALSGSTKTETDPKEQHHNFNVRFFHKPILCLHCRDYIWGAGYIGYGCYKCAECVHFKCLLFVAKKSNCKNTENPSSSKLDLITKSNLYPIENWNANLVKQWLAVVNLHRYAEVFSKYNITGSKLIMLNSDHLNEYRIRDSYHHKAILECCKELLVRSRQYSTYAQMNREQNEFTEFLKRNPYRASKHYFLLHTMSVQTSCHLCLRPFLGIVHQALVCQECGLMVHRQCSSIGLPNCQLNISRQIPNKHYLFGVSLFDLNTDEISSAPMLLVKAFTHIEETAARTSEDLYDAYRLSADTAKIDQIKQQLNENGIELTIFDRYDLNTICAIVKAFLRDLQNSVISEEIYIKLIENIQTISSNDLRLLIKDQLHPTHYFCLKYIMSHLIRVWTYQYKTRGCHYLPDKIFHIFRTILMRPAWENIIEIVNYVDKQTLVIQRLMLECDWGVDLPEYKTRPKRSLTSKSENSSTVGSNLTAIASKFIPKFIPRLNVDQKSSIDNQEWYWANIVNRDNTNLILKGCPDGSFIVRNSTDKNLMAPYTLCVMKGTFVKSIKIFKQDMDSEAHLTYYDIEKPCRFESVQALIDYYSRVSLKEYNHNLELKLTYGVSKFKFGRASEWSIDKLYSSFKEALDKYELLTKTCDNLEQDLSLIREDIAQKRVASDAFTKIISIFENQLEQANSFLTNNLIKKSNAVSASAILATQFMPSNQEDKAEKILHNNTLNIEKKISSLKVKKQEIVESIEYLNLNLSELQEKLDSLRPELIELRKKRENYHMWLLQRGENEDKIQTVIEPLRQNPNNKAETSGSTETGEKPEHTTNENNYVKLKTSNSVGSALNEMNSSVNSNAGSTLPKSKTELVSLGAASEVSTHFDSVNWYRADYTREQAEDELKEKSVGTFLVRKSAYANSKYVLSVMSQFNQIIHVVIDESHEKYFLKSQNQHRRIVNKDSNLLNESKRSRSPSVSDKLSSSTSTMSSSESDMRTLKRESIDKFETLTDLVVFYSKNMLQIGNKTWNVVLTKPAFLDKKKTV